MPAGGISGKGGDCTYGTTPGTQVSELTKWTFNPKTNCPAWASNKSGGFKKRVAGIRDASGSLEGKWDPTNPITSGLQDGAMVTLNLITMAGSQFTVPAIIEGLKVDVDIDSGQPVAWSADFSITGPWTAPTATTILGPIGQPATEVQPAISPEEVLAQAQQQQPGQNQPQAQQQVMAPATGQQQQGQPQARAQDRPAAAQDMDPRLLQLVAHAVAQAMQAYQHGQGAATGQAA